MSPAPSDAAIETLMQDFSLEMTGKDVEALREAAPSIAPGTRVNVTFLGNEDLDMRVTAAQAVKELGFVPVPHISARRIKSEDELRDFMQGLVDVDAAKHIFAVGGDPSEPMGPYGSSLEMIQSEVFSDYGVEEVSIAGYPEGHPYMSDEAFLRETHDKLASLDNQNMSSSIITQFGFDIDPVANWLNTLAGENITVPVRIGVPGPAGIRRLLKYAKRFGVGASAGIALKYGFSLTNLVGTAGPDKFLKELAEETQDSEFQGDVNIHFYTFGGVARTAEWAQDFTEKF
ncbi:MAG TPA: methylenetetrahydrofolate reductase [Candidatus Yaniella excrementigallinarum]|nr:methylenetetrahydrofolate reductase [Candidatus Yaniella excrementigallinarum]